MKNYDIVIEGLPILKGYSMFGLTTIKQTIVDYGYIWLTFLFFIIFVLFSVFIQHRKVSLGFTMSFLALVSIPASIIFVLVIMFGVPEVNIDKWESTHITKYVEGLEVVKEEAYNISDIYKEKGLAYVDFVVDGKVKVAEAELHYEENLESSYVSYRKMDLDYKEELSRYALLPNKPMYELGEVYLIELHLDKEQIKNIDKYK